MSQDIRRTVSFGCPVRKLNVSKKNISGKNAEILRRKGEKSRPKYRFIIQLEIKLLRA